MKRRTARAVENSQRGHKAKVRKWMLYYDRQETFEHAARIRYTITHDWMKTDNREIVRGLQRIEELLLEAVK